MAKNDNQPGRRPEIETWLDSKGVRWRFEPDIPVENFDMRKSLNNQARFTPLDDSVVDRYVNDMARGDEFPPVVASDAKKFVIIDGNHRLQAHDRRQTKLPAYIVTGDSQVLTAMTFEANVKHGLPTSEDERSQHAVWLIDHGATLESAAGAVGLSTYKVQKSWDRTRAERRARRLDVRAWDAVALPCRQPLNSIRMDESFVIAVQYSVRYQWNVAETKEVVGRLNRQTSVAGQQAELEKIRNEYRDRAQGSAGGVLRSRSQASPIRNTRAVLTRVASMSAESLLGIDLSDEEVADLKQRIADAKGALTELETSLEKVSK